MQVIGLIGGLSWESSIEYYRLINQAVRERLGGVHSAECVLYSFDFEAIEELQHRGDWDELSRRMTMAGTRLREAGADFLVICSNTMHKTAGTLAAATGLPILHIADPTAAAVKRAGLQTVGLLGTRFTMEEDFYRLRLEREHGLRVFIPDAEARAAVHHIIYTELVAGIIRPESRQVYAEIIGGLKQAGADGIILGCTEISLLVHPEHVDLPLFDTTALHAEAAVERALAFD
jgi:aspartate racemase